VIRLASRILLIALGLLVCLPFHYAHKLTGRPRPGRAASCSGWDARPACA
jgi:hypothetical protein